MGWVSPGSHTQHSRSLCVSPRPVLGLFQQEKNVLLVDWGLHTNVVTKMCDHGQRGASYPKLRTERKINEQLMGKHVLK